MTPPDADLHLLGLLAAEVRRRHHVAKAAGRAYEHALRANGAAAEQVTIAVYAIRELLAAMTDGAGHDGRHDLDAARLVARGVLEPEATP